MTVDNTTLCQHIPIHNSVKIEYAMYVFIAATMVEVWPLVVTMVEVILSYRIVLCPYTVCTITLCLLVCMQYTYIFN